ncbi:ATP phosphoribosyltransferase [Patescibacteria group bacterium]|nr:ATP phosphoribosyltransferase [Patescibacteria group bacterium]MBU4512113.1 ATP phosphoribosyltransferase [Patescibacteria group bacterium]MCG2694357.1 ATP phosphoribosyltransferase [Candidatus Parcubacteria bacterium]
MSLKNNKLKIAIPNKGRLSDASIEILKTIGLDFEVHERQLYSSAENLNIEILYIRAGNIPEYVQDGIADLGITGLDLVKERQSQVQILEKLHFGNGKIIIAVPEKSAIENPKQLENKKIATSYPAIAKKYLENQGINADIIEIEGALEITPALGLSDAIVDLTSTGSTLKMNNLKTIKEIMATEAVLIGNSQSLDQKKQEINNIVLRFESVMTAQRKRYIMMNAPKELLPAIKKVAPGLASPTIMDLAKPGMIAVHSVVDRKNIWETVEKLKKIGASDILVIPIEKMVS